MKISIAGPKHLTNYKTIKEIIDTVVNQKNIEITEIVSNHTPGTSILSERYAKEHKIPIVIYETDWNQDTILSIAKRDNAIANYIDALILIRSNLMNTNGNIRIAETMIRKNKVVYGVDTQGK